jgi:2-polyprenyl-3-methyl-5-hydroxy-6-metoxy-1,4-benzoquinol methylase
VIATATLAVPCTICRTDDARLLYRPRLSPGPVVRCRGCGLVYVSPVEHPERLAATNPDEKDGRLLDVAEAPADKALYLAESEVKAPVYREILNRLALVIDPPGTLLDVGSYLGLFLKSAVARGWRGRGIEPDRDAWQHSTSTLGLDVAWGTLATCPQPKGAFDAVTLLQVLEHVPDPRQTLVDVRGLLRRGGALIVEVPNIDCWPVRALGRRHRHFAKHHFTFFSPRTLTRLLEDCGFDIVSVGFPARQISMRRLAWSLQSWHPGLAKLAGPVLRAGAVQNRVLRLNLREVLSVCARSTKVTEA